jgi:hypothetical protein
MLFRAPRMSWRDPRELIEEGVVQRLC